MRALLLAGLLALPLLLAGCTGPATPHPASGSGDAPAAPAQPASPANQTTPPSQAAPGGLTNAQLLAAARAFDGDAAWALVKSQVVAQEPCLASGAPDPAPPPAGTQACTPLDRIPGTAGNNATAQRISDWMARASALGTWRVRYDPFTATFEGQPLPAHNVVAERPGKTNQTLYLVAHYDSRPCADEDPVPANRTQPVLGANDGGSGVAVMVELARALGDRAMNLTLRFVFVDAEDMGDSGHGCGAGTAWAQGAEHYAASLSPEEVRDARGLVLLDLVGDPAMQLRREGVSAQPPNLDVQSALWGWGHALGSPQFLDAVGPPIDDDHLSFIKRGIPSVDVIDLRDRPGDAVFPDSHHTTFDDLAHVSPASLQAVGQATLAAVLAWDGGGWDNGLK